MLRAMWPNALIEAARLADRMLDRGDRDGQLVRWCGCGSSGRPRQCKAVFYYRCEHQPMVIATECLPWLRAYDRNFAAFEAKYPSRK
jgi:hypothetical protein